MIVIDCGVASEFIEFDDIQLRLDQELIVCTIYWPSNTNIRNLNISLKDLLKAQEMEGKMHVLFTQRLTNKSIECLRALVTVMTFSRICPSIHFA